MSFYELPTIRFGFLFCFYFSAKKERKQQDFGQITTIRFDLKHKILINL